MRFPVLVLLVLLAGCIQTPGGGGPTTPAVDLAKPMSWGFEGKKCHEADFALLVDKAKLQSSLPEGFVVADASSLGGLPFAPDTGKGAVVATTFVCEETDLNATYAEGQVAILVEAPKVDAPNFTAAGLNFYEVHRYLAQGQPGPAYDALNWSHEHGNVTSKMATDGGSGAVDGHDGKAYSLSITTPTGAEATGIARFWHQVPTGLAWFDYAPAAGTQQRLGAATCAIQPGTPLHEVSGMTSCAPESSLGLGFPSLAGPVTFRYEPGLNATK